MSQPAAPTVDTLLLGIGNRLLSDEGVGSRVIDYLEANPLADPAVQLLDGGTLSFTLAGEIAAHPYLIVVDAARTGNPPGTLCCYPGDELERHLARAAGSVHEVGLQDLLDISRLSDSFPKRRALIGIEPLSLDWGEELSPPVAAALPQVRAMVVELLRQWRSATV